MLAPVPSARLDLRSIKWSATCTDASQASPGTYLMP